MRNRIKRLTQKSWFSNGITSLIIVNFFTLLAGTEGYNLGAIEIVILTIFTFEMLAKMFGYGLQVWSKDAWNWFDALVVGIGIFLQADLIPLPEALGGLRALRLVRLFGRIKSTKTLIQAIIASSHQLAGVGLFSGLFLLIFTLMATMTFQTTLPEWFGSFGTSLTTLLSLSIFSGVEVVGLSWEVSKFGTLLVFPGFFLTVPLTALNLVIAVLSNAVGMTEGQEEQLTREEFDELKRSIEAANNKLDALLKIRS